jgi:hypothetical protein
MDIRRLIAPAAVAAASIALPATAAAETIYGTLTGPAGPNGRLTLTCERGAASAVADRSGSYRLTVAGRGRCHLRVNNMPPPGELVFVYDEPTRYDYEVTVVGGVARIERR